MAASTVRGVEPPSYPRECECDALLATGDVAQIRPIRPDDAPGLVQFHDRLSEESIHRRFFSAHPHLRAAEVERFTCVDYRDRLALVAEVDGSLAAVARYDRSPGTDRAEVAFVVADGLQGRGLATLLLEHLAGAGRRRGLATFFAETLADNHPMIEVFKRAGFPCRLEYSQGVVDVSFPIAPSQRFLDAVIERHLHAVRSWLESRLASADAGDPEDLLAFGATDDSTPVVALELSPVGRPRRFVALARAVGQHKPVIVFLRAKGETRLALAELCQQAGVETVGGPNALAERTGQLQLELAAGTWQPAGRGALIDLDGCDVARGRMALDYGPRTPEVSSSSRTHPGEELLGAAATEDLLTSYSLLPAVMGTSDVPEGLSVSVSTDPYRGLALRLVTGCTLGPALHTRVLPLSNLDAQELVEQAAPRCPDPGPLVGWVLRVARLVDDQADVSCLNVPLGTGEDQGAAQVWVGRPRSTDDDPFVSKLRVSAGVALLSGEGRDFQSCRAS